MTRRRWDGRSLAGRVALLTSVAVVVAVTALAVGAYVTARVQLHHQLDHSLRERARSAAESGRLELLLGQYNISSLALGAADVRIAFVSEDGTSQPLDREEPIRLGRPELDVASGRSAESLRTIASAGHDYRVVAVPSETDGVALVMAQPLDEQQRVLRRIGLVCLLFGGLGVLGSGLVGWAVARNGLRPVRRLTADVEGVARTEDLTPLPVEGHDEIARLATAFNQMLTALDASRERQRRLVTDAGHELRTPLTSVRTNIDLLAMSDSAEVGLSAHDRAELLDDIRGQIGELTTLIGDLTELAREEPLAPAVGTVDLADVVDAAVQRVRRRALAVHFDVECVSWPVVGEQAALERAVTNLLDNAAKWSPSQATVTVRLVADGPVGVLTVDDAGPGIDPADREHVFDRFWRARESRSMPGSGLGLSIVRQVAERHAGSVEADAAPGGGARLVLRIPGVGDGADA